MTWAPSSISAPGLPLSPRGLIWTGRFSLPVSAPPWRTAGEVAGQLMITYEWSDWRNGMFIWIQSVYVRAENRRKGVFKALYDHVIELASSPGYCGVRLYVHDGNTSARETYLRLGMVEPGYTVLETPDELKHEDES